ncbi:oxygen-independent coproporphyrinogen III oxidase [Thiolapillus brandeum]|uniref:Coproporphyrinogen-III oxidase n=1 Tax=Thiolapillus brandeum TaxID=1076588 RepID=A0A7U6GKR9_9GAMM|nr:oxygen-independent coproporphyrinogen III oxidase [Thiolapillus brandeum]BAO45329.1 oxygen-independent coproporphyrinogen III oxidase [Thiolapillus brandeum]
MEQQLILDDALIAKYDQSGPRYTSYPTAVQFHEDFTADDYAAIARETNASGRPLSLYFHIPFCDTICFYCACNKVATKDRSKGDEYLQRLYREIALQGELFDRSRPVEQLHWGGGTPTFISHGEMRELMRVTGEHFQLLPDDQGEYSIEIDPREATAETVGVLREIGFNRMSLGVQDFDPRVQKAVNRIQSEEETLAVLNAARAEGFRSVSIDLIYGLPHQTRESFETTLERIIDVGPDRLSVFNYAHLPQIFKPQRRIEVDELPPPEVKLEILHMTAAKLAQAGYVYIGMDHFAKPDDELAVAQREGTLYRNFQGYSTHSNCDLVGMGITSIGSVGNCYAQNLKGLDDYYPVIDAGKLPVFRGVRLSRDDELRRDVITRLICNFALDFSAVEKQWSIDFREYFSAELERLSGMVGDGLLEITDQGIQVLPVGRMLIRNICMVFDAYLKDSKGQRFSKVI